MFKDLLVKNFRGFRELPVKQLERVNLIAGKNNTGKTALLEAIRLHCDPTDSLLPTEINQGRGIEDAAKAFAELWAWLFFDRDPDRQVELSSQDDHGKTRTVTYYLTDIAGARSGAAGVPESPANFPGQGWHAHSPCLVIKYEGPGGDNRIVWVIGGQGEAWYTAKEGWHAASELIVSGLPSAHRDLRHFSALETQKRLGELLPSLQILEPRLVRLSLAVLGHPQEPVIHGDIGLSRLVPVPLMGEGIRRLLSILLTIFNTPGGVVLIDEIETGLHYSVVVNVWKAIATAARSANVQLFATTHSWECIRFAHQAFKESKEYDFRLHRLDRDGNQINVRSYDSDMIETALTSGLEMR